MIRPYLSLLLSLTMIPTGLGTTNLSLNHSQEKLVQQINTSPTLDFKQTGYKSYNSSFQHYIDYALPAIQTEKRLEEEQAAKLKADQEAQAAAQENQRQIAAEQARLAATKIVPQAEVAVPIPAAPANFDYVSLIRQRCNELGCNADQMLRVMYCESGGRANAYNARGGYSGLFQQAPAYWAKRAAAAGVPGADIFDPYAQIIVATKMFAEGGAGNWTCK